jgi:hypothetical protein
MNWRAKRRRWRVQDAVPEGHDRDRGLHESDDGVREKRDLETAPRPVLNLDLTSCAAARLPGIRLNANKTQPRTAHRSFADEERGLALTSDGSGRITSSAMLE